ncbi:hypothetical protein Bbelb_275970 [Branchiostoma belcheri]|nr:hypothetical protein Bbelb_275970 [Branchiostoma belcheri]
MVIVVSLLKKPTLQQKKDETKQIEGIGPTARRIARRPQVGGRSDPREGWGSDDAEYTVLNEEIDAMHTHFPSETCQQVFGAVHAHVRRVVSSASATRHTCVSGQTSARLRADLAAMAVISNDGKTVVRPTSKTGSY